MTSMKNKIPSLSIKIRKNGRRVPFFLPTKEKPAPRGDEEDLIKPITRKLLIYYSMDSL